MSSDTGGWDDPAWNPKHQTPEPDPDWEREKAQSKEDEDDESN